VTATLTDVQFTFAGDIEAKGIGSEHEGWRQHLERTLGRDHVIHQSGLPHRDTAPLYWRSAVNWMPYRPTLPFVRACSPLKLTDGLASGRPILSADVPKCRRYPEWVTTYEGAAEASARLSMLLDEADTPRAAEHRANQIGAARRQTCSARAEQL